MNLVRSTVALCCTLLLAACFPPSTDHPIGGSRAGADRALSGTWNGVMDEADKGADRAIFRFRDNHNGTMAVQIDSAKKDDEDRMTATITAARAGANRFMNVTILTTGKSDDTDKSADGDKQRGTLPLLYRFEGSALVLYLMDEDKTKAAIKAGKIKGEVEPGQFGDAILTADSRTLDAFLASDEGAALFSEKFATLTKAD